MVVATVGPTTLGVVVITVAKATAPVILGPATRRRRRPCRVRAEGKTVSGRALASRAVGPWPRRTTKSRSCPTDEGRGEDARRAAGPRSRDVGRRRTAPRSGS